MKKRIFLAAICIVLISASLCQALPTYTIAAGPNRITDGGPFIVNGSFDTFCLETGEYIAIGGTYRGSIDSVVYYGTPAGHTVTVNSGEALNSKVIGLYDYYLDHQATLNASSTALAGIQEAIWAWQGQASAPSGDDYYTNYQNYVGTVRNIEVLNLWDSDATAYTAGGADQSLLIVGSVPEPSILILLGLSLMGLAGVRRKFSKK